MGKRWAMGLDVSRLTSRRTENSVCRFSNSTLQLCVLIGDAVRKLMETRSPRAARLEKMGGVHEKLSATVENDLAFALTTRS